jgi:hypothetical protein
MPAEHDDDSSAGTSDDGSQAGPEGVAAELVEMALVPYDIGVSKEGSTFVTLREGGPAVRMFDRELTADLSRLYFLAKRRVPGPGAVSDALRILDAMARESEPVQVALRVARHRERIIVNLAADERQSVVVGKGGWKQRRRSPVLFWKTGLTAPHPRPASPDRGDVDLLRPLLNVTDDDWDLLVGWLVAGLIPDIPHAILVVRGQQGTGKSTAQRMLRTVLDPSHATSASLPSKEADFAALANAAYVLAFGNVSTIKPAMSDTLCTVVTGGSRVSRKLYSDLDVAVATYRRVVMIDGIALPSVRGDLADRILPIDLVPIPRESRRFEQDLEERFSAVLPRVLSGLFNLLAEVLDIIDDVEVEDPPRMADFALVLEAVDQVRGSSSLETYLASAASLALDVVESDTVATALEAFTSDEDFERWEGTASELLQQLAPESPPSDWPRSAQSMSDRVRRAIPALHTIGLSVKMGVRHGPRRRLIVITLREDIVDDG